MIPVLAARAGPNRSCPIKRLAHVFTLNYGQKLFLLATLPLIFAVAAISLVVADQSRNVAQREIEMLETQLIAAKKEELKNYISIARTAIGFIYGNALPDDERAKTGVAQILAAMIYGQDGYFYVYDYNGKNLVAPRQTWLINRYWMGLEDAEGVQVVDKIIGIARQGGGYHSYVWPKPSTGRDGQMISYTVGLQDWRWAIGTGVFVDDILGSVALVRAKTEARVRQTFFQIGAITLTALLLVFGSGMVVTIRERRLADAKLKQLTQRVFDAQEEERGRVARELHDSISQMLVGVRYTLELARKRQTGGDLRAGESLTSGIEHLNGAIQEVRRISRDLRPGVLDDLGLGPALQALMEDFGQRTGISTEFETVVFRNRLDPEAKIALYRIAQEALTNIEKHAGATWIRLLVRGTKTGALLRIEDNGNGMVWPEAARKPDGGLGLRNMQERIERLDGTLHIKSSRRGTVIEAQVPLTHMLAPQGRMPQKPPEPPALKDTA